MMERKNAVTNVRFQERRQTNKKKKIAEQDRGHGTEPKNRENKAMTRGSSREGVTRQPRTGDAAELKKKR